MARDTGSLLDEFFDAIQRGDIEAVAPLYADDVQVWHNVTDRAIDKAASLGLLRYWSGQVSDMRYEVVERSCFDGGAVQRHVIHGRAGDEALAAPICIVFHVADDQITRIYEYLDPAAVAAVFGPRPAGSAGSS
jgi:ketosteroid isomerase-like protein